MEFKKIFGRFFPSLLYRIRFPTISVEGKKKEKKQEIEKLTRFHFWSMFSFRNFATSPLLSPSVTRKRRWKKEERGGKNTASTAMGRGGCIFSENTVTTLSRHRRSWKEWKNNILTFRAPSFPFPYHIPPVSRCTFFLSPTFSSQRIIHIHIYIYIDCAREKRKNKQLLSMHSSTICQIMQVYGSLISLSILINTKE